MLNYHFLLDLAIIIISTKLLGLVSRKVHMPQVVGALLAGIILGPSLINIVNETDFIRKTAEIGVIVILFTAGLETDLKEIKKSGKASFLIALLGVFVPLIFGFGIAMLFFPGFDSKTLLMNIFIGVIITATSVSISVETLQELGKLNTKTGTTIMTAALIDDVLGIVILTIATSFASSNTEASIGITVLTVVLKIAAFFVFATLVGIILNKLFEKYSKHLNEKRRFPIISFSLCLLMAFIAEHYFNVADITGAFIAGMVFSNTTHARYIERRVSTLSYLYLSPIFFASIGISTNLRDLDLKMLFFALCLLVVAILSKVLGCGFGARMCKFGKREALRIGVGMSARSEVALIVANNGVSYGIMNPQLFPAVILLVIVTSIVTPILLKVTYSEIDTAEVKCSH